MSAERRSFDCSIDRGDRITVSEPGIRPWIGVVGAVKFSPITGWWFEVAREDDGLSYVVPESRATA
jgi:hypothetical protein